MWLRILAFSFFLIPNAHAARSCEVLLSIGGLIENHLHQHLQLNTISSDPEMVRLLIGRTREFWLNEIRALKPSAQRALLKSLHRFRVTDDVSDAETDALDAYIEMESHYQRDITTLFPYSHELAHALQVLSRPLAQWALVRRFWFYWDQLVETPLTANEEHESHLKEAQLHVFLIRNDNEKRRYVRLILEQTEQVKSGAVDQQSLDEMAKVSLYAKWAPRPNDLFGKLYLPNQTATPRLRKALRELDELDTYGDIQHLIIALQPNGGPEILARILDADALVEEH